MFNCKITQSITKYFSCTTNELHRESYRIADQFENIFTLEYSAHRVYLGSTGHLSRTFTTLNLLGV